MTHADTVPAALEPQEQAIWRTELLAAMAAARDLPPELDSSLADAALARATTELRGRGLLRPPRGAAPTVLALVDWGRGLARLGTVVLLVGLVVLAVLLVTLAPVWQPLLLHWGSEGGR